MQLHTPEKLLTTAPREGRATIGRPTTIQPGVPDGFRACTRCGEIYVLEHFYSRHRGDGTRIWTCPVCMRKYNKERRRTLSTERHSRRWSLPTVRDEEPVAQIPDSDCAAQLVIISACWLSCVEVGAEAIRRMMDRLVDATYLPGSVTTEERARLRSVVERYRVGTVALEMVERTLHAVDVAHHLARRA